MRFWKKTFRLSKRKQSDTWKIPVLMIDDEIYLVWYLPAWVKLDAYYDSGTWAGDSWKANYNNEWQDNNILFVIWWYGLEFVCDAWWKYKNIVSVRVWANNNIFLSACRDKRHNIYSFENICRAIRCMKLNMIRQKELWTLRQIQAESVNQLMTSCQYRLSQAEQAYDMAKTKYDNLLSTDGMPHYNHKGKYYMFLTGASSTVDVYYNGMLEIN